MSSGPTSTGSPQREPAAGSRRSRRPSRRAILVAAAVVGGAAVVSGSLAAIAVSSHASVQTNCEATPSACGYPDATDTGSSPVAALKVVPSTNTTGPGWNYVASTHTLNVTGSGTVLSGMYLVGTLNVTASNVTIKNDTIVTSGANGLFGISIRHTAGVTVENCTISGTNATSGRVDTAISDAYEDSTGLVIADNNISDARTGIQLAAGQVTGNYIHDPGYIAGDHTNGVLANGGTGQLTITGNTILDSLGQTDAISLDTNSIAGPVTNKTVENNLLAGGSYPIYGGTAFSHATSNILIENNRFGQAFFPKSGQFGPVAYFDSTGAGNVWSGNVWDSTGATVPAP
jgi:hypothetical protein